MSTSNKETVSADKKCAIVFAFLVSTWILGCTDVALGFGNPGSIAFGGGSRRSAFSNPSRGAFSSHPRTYETVSRRYPEHKDEQASQIVHESSTTASASAVSEPATTVSAASKPLDRGNPESKPLDLAPQTAPVKPSQPETPAVAGQHEDSKFPRGSDEFAKNVVKQKPAANEPSAIAEALEQYRILEWDRADNLLTNSLEKGLLSTSEESNACVLLGAMAYQLGQIDQANTYFTKAHLLDPSAAPSSELFPPQVVEFYKSVGRNTGE
jgi:hypothetical protein